MSKPTKRDRVRSLMGHIDVASHLCSTMCRHAPPPMDVTWTRLADVVERLEVCLALAKELSKED